ncbi:hypothetical protein D2Q93_13310 [Alicyclobacillaceae bacterium I2511]|nr:hypothetical protein D2Q93_13310 [Alicyclobacillaceae bacterium I2511]
MAPTLGRKGGTWLHRDWMTETEWIVACLIGTPFVFALGRWSARLRWSTPAEQKYTLPEFVRQTRG